MHSLTSSPAVDADCDAVFALLGAAAEALAARGFRNWLPGYERERLVKDIADGVVHVVRDAQGTIVATYMLRTHPTHDYHGIDWGDACPRPRYLNRLAVDPARMSEGIGGWCLAHIVDMCAAEAATSVRCDVIAANVPLRRFYERQGWHVRGLRSHSGWEFAVYERETGNR